MKADKMTQMLMPVSGVGTVSVPLQQSAFPRRLRAGKRGRSWRECHALPALRTRILTGAGLLSTAEGIPNSPLALAIFGVGRGTQSH
jgi:hypothetical protein